MKEKLFDSEAKVMEMIWEKSLISAKDISLIATKTIGWNKNTTYTVIKKLEAKGFIRSEYLGFICTPLVSQNEIQKVEAASLVNKVFSGSRKAFFRHGLKMSRYPKKKSMSCVNSLIIGDAYAILSLNTSGKCCPVPYRIVHIGLDIVKLLHIRPGLHIGSIGFLFLFQQTSAFLPKRFTEDSFVIPMLSKYFLAAWC